MLDLSASLSNPRRLRALRRVALLDTSVDQAFDRLTRLVARFLNVPVALVSLVDEERQVFRGCIGLPEPWASARETPLSHSFCKHVVHLGTPLVISDARDHALVRDNLAIPDLLVVAYAGIPLITSDGSVLGTLCAIDHEPRDWSEVDLSTLADLAASVMTELELVAALRQSAQRADRIARLQAMTAALSDAITPPHVGDVVLRHGLPAVEATAGTVATLLFGMLGGVYADRWNRRTTMATVDLLRAATVLKTLTLDGDQQIGINIVARAIEEPMRWIATNAGQEGSIVVQKVRDLKDDEGFNALNDEYENPVEAGVIDPTKVTRTALQNAASISGLLLTTEALIVERKEDKPAAPAGGGGGMGGMY